MEEVKKKIRSFKDLDVYQNSYSVMLLVFKHILLKLELLEKQVSQNSEEIQMIFSALKQLLNSNQEPRKPIGFRTGKED